jgi:hypothetical protein
MIDIVGILFEQSAQGVLSVARIINQQKRITVRRVLA